MGICSAKKKCNSQSIPILKNYFHQPNERYQIQQQEIHQGCKQSFPQQQSYQQLQSQTEQVQQKPLDKNSENFEQPEQRAKHLKNNDDVQLKSIQSEPSQQFESGICYMCKEEDQNLMKLECNHFYHKECLIELLLYQNQCLCNKKIILINKYVKQSIIDIIMKNRLQMLFENNQQKIQLVKCKNKNCAFFFVYDEKKNKSFSKEYYCNNCERMQGYDQEMCNQIDQQKIFYSDLQVNQCYSCKKVIERDEVKLDCKHKWHIECLKEEVIKNLKYKCYCGKKINDNCLKIDQEQLKSLKNNLFEQQLSRIINSYNIKFDVCKQDCGFFWISDYKEQDVQNLVHCGKCDYEEKLKVPKCFSCKKEFFGQKITLQNCQHEYHILCALKLVENKKIGDKIVCSCKSILDNQDLQTIGIQCMYCEKYDENLYQFKCQHHIHKQCFDDHYLDFINLSCCGISILDEISNKDLEEIRDKIYAQKNGTKFFCQKCGNKKGKLLKLNCEHFIDEQCLNELINTEYLNNGYIQCQCNQQISEDLILKIF